MRTYAQQSSAAVLDGVQKSVTLSFSADPNHPTSQLAFSPSPFVFIGDEDGATVTITLENAKLADTPNDFFTSIFPTSPDPSKLSINRDNDNEVTITVNNKPKSYLRPWALSFNVNINPMGTSSDAVIMASPTLYLVLGSAEEPSADVTLQYTRSSGLFELAAAERVVNNLILINPSPSITITINLSSDDPDVKFNSAPIVPEGGSLGGVVPQIVSDTQLTISTTENSDRFVNFRFALDVPTSGSSITVLSPDPILINATIGDG